MMKKLLTVIMATLALNFLFIAGSVGWLYSSGKLDREKVKAIKEVVFATTAPTTQLSGPTTKPLSKLEQLTAKKLGRTTVEQVQLTQQTHDTQAAELDRRKRELEDLQKQVDFAQRQVEKDRLELKLSREQFTKQTDLAKKEQTDKGFVDALALYSAMPAKQAKEVFLSLDDATIRRYLQAMEPRAASKIIKEFKSSEEVKRIQVVVEGMKTPQRTSAQEQDASAIPAASSASTSAEMRK
jgi:hypothetical protein